MLATFPSQKDAIAPDLELLGHSCSERSSHSAELRGGREQLWLKCHKLSLFLLRLSGFSGINVS